MSQFLYFVPGDDTGWQRIPHLPGKPTYIKQQHFQPKGCDDALSGHIYCYNGRDIRPFHQSQTWRPVPPDQGYWIGWDKLPREADLRMPAEELLSSHDVLLANGEKWKIPIARSIPRKLMMDDTGQWQSGKPLAKHAHLFALAGEAFDGFMAMADEDDAAREEFENFDLMPLVLRAIRSNYRVGDYEISLLGLLTQETLLQIVQAVLDLSFLSNLEKKTDDQAAATSHSPNGHSDTTTPKAAPVLQSSSA